jgi:hypothetical protein
MKRRKPARLVVGAIVLLALAAAAIGLVTTRHSRNKLRESALLKARADAIVSKKQVETIKAGKNAEAAVGTENRGPDSSPDIEAYLLRAYPAADIPLEATIAAQNGWAALNASAHSAGTWQLIGPSKATYPAVLDPFLFDGAQYVASGRVTAMAIGPSCVHGACPIYVAAAGGGIWRAKDALAGSPNWEFVSASFATNAIGSLIMDPNDPTGKTLLAGTGEPNVSIDSEAGMGIYKSTDGGNTWTLLLGSVATASNFQGRAVASLAITPAGDILASIARAVRGVSSTDGAATSNPPPPVAGFGVYKSTDGGATFTNLTPGAFGSARGSNEVRVDPNSASTYYASFLGAGVWRTTDGGATWTQIKNPLNPPNNANNTDRSEFALATLPGSFTRMYVGQGASGGPAARVFRTNDAAGAAVFADITTPQNVGYCTGQCWYDNVLYSPAGAPDIVYIGGSFSYGDLHGRDNGRAWLLSTNGGDPVPTWSDLTQDGNPNHADAIHPDQHAIVTVPGNPLQFITGSDGGVVGSDGLFADVSYKCDSRGLNAADTAYCKSLLNRVPNQLLNMNEGLSTLQFQSLSASAKRPKNNLQGGTQDNGTFQYTGSSVVWPQEIYGDGGQSGFNASDDGLRFNTFTGQANDGNFRNGDPTKWVIISAPILSSPEGSLFYPPIISDPNSANAGSIFQGSFSVWRTQDWGGNRDVLEANCPEFTTSATQPGCGDFVQIGPPGATDLGGAAYSAPPPARAGGAVIVIARRAADNGAAWAATTAGRVFISTNVNDPPGSVVWTRIDNKSGGTSPGRVPTRIAIDPTNANHAWISYSGYSAATPLQPGHVFEVTWNGVAATWTSLDGTTLPDLPVTDLARDDVTGDLYAASDFGVMKGVGTTWAVAGTGLPMVEVPGLTIIPSARLLYAATHGRSAWLLQLP